MHLGRSGVSICAGISGDKIVLWEEVKGPWSGQKAAEMYKGPISKALQKHRPKKATWKVLEDNDPTGFKSSKGREAKKACGMKAESLPRYSADLNPLDYCLWADIERRMLATKKQGKESKAAYAKRLRRVALKTDRGTVRKAVQAPPSQTFSIGQWNSACLQNRSCGPPHPSLCCCRR